MLNAIWLLLWITFYSFNYLHYLPCRHCYWSFSGFQRIWFHLCMSPFHAKMGSAFQHQDISDLLSLKILQALSFGPKAAGKEHSLPAKSIPIRWLPYFFPADNFLFLLEVWLPILFRQTLRFCLRQQLKSQSGCKAIQSGYLYEWG